MNLLSILIFLPIAAALLILVLPTGFNHRFKQISLSVSLIQFLLSLFIYTNFNQSIGGISKENEFQFVEKLSWIRLDLGSIGKLEIDYFLGRFGDKCEWLN